MLAAAVGGKSGDRVDQTDLDRLRLRPEDGGKTQQAGGGGGLDKLAAGGSVYLSFDVPDFSKADLLLTDLVLGYADGPHIAIARDLPPVTIQTSRIEVVGRGTLPSMGRPAPGPAETLPAPIPTLPFEPTLDRTFVSRDTLRLFFKAVQRSPLPLKATISALTPDGTVIITFDRTLPADRQASLDVSLPLAQLTPGPYRLQVTVSAGAISDTREIGFVVK